VLFTAQDQQTIRDASGSKPTANTQALAPPRCAPPGRPDHNLSRPAPRPSFSTGARRVIGIGRVKMPTLAIASGNWKSELRAHCLFWIVATAKVAGGQFQMRHVPGAIQTRLPRQSSMLMQAGARFGSSRQARPPAGRSAVAAKLWWFALRLAGRSAPAVVQEPMTARQEDHHLSTRRGGTATEPDVDVPKIVAAAGGQSFSLPVPDPPVIAEARAAVFTGWRARAITSFPTSIRLISCGGLAALPPMRTSCSTLSRGLIGALMLTSATGRPPQR
jgi:DNA topoisomerase-3